MHYPVHQFGRTNSSTFRNQTVRLQSLDLARSNQESDFVLEQKDRI